MSIRKSAILICLFVSTSLFANYGPTDVFVRVVDSGAALCCVVGMPDNRYMIYDAGNYSGEGSLTFSKVQEIIPAGSDIELLVLSHSDSDHLGAVDEICDDYNILRVLRPGYQRTTATWRNAIARVLLEEETEGCIDISLDENEFPM